MKKTLLIVLALCMCHTVFSQRFPPRRMVIMKPVATNEVKLNLAMVLGAFPEISYERVWANNVGLGVSARVSLINSFKTKYQFTPYCRFYFGESFIKSFFVEANLGIIGYEKYTIRYDPYPSTTENAVDLGVGLALGYKYVNRNGLIGEVFVGLGRTVDDRIYSRCGVSMGKLF